MCIRDRLGGLGGIHAGGGLVEQKQAGVGGERAHDLQAALRAVGPVSYTHLDVYKRQDLKKEGFVPAPELMERIDSSHLTEGMKEHLDRQFGIARCV